MTAPRPRLRAGVSRRGLLRAGASAGVGLGAVAASTACAQAPASTEVGPHKVGPVNLSDDPDNPFGVDGTVPLEVIIFKGGFGDAYATEGHQPQYKEKFPDAEVYHVGTEQINEAALPRFRTFDPPDVLMNAGGDAILPDTLIDEGQLLDLTVLLDAPSIDNPSLTVREILRDGVVEAGQIGEGEEVWALSYAYVGYGLWYSQKLFFEEGWEVPETWPEFMDLCDTIKSAGITPFAYPGRYPYYMYDPIFTLAARHGGAKVIKNLEEDFDAKAWENDSILAALAAWEEFAAAKFVHPDAHNWSHREAQGEWARGEVAFVPAGSWLENEEDAEIPPGFKMGFMPVPPLDGSEDPGLVWGTPSQHFVVPKYANNPAGALEYLRIMLSKQGTAAWASNTASLNAAAESIVVAERPGFTSLQPFLEDPNNIMQPELATIHGTFMDNHVSPEINKLLRGDLTADRMISRIVSRL